MECFMVEILMWEKYEAKFMIIPFRNNQILHHFLPCV